MLHTEAKFIIVEDQDDFLASLNKKFKEEAWFQQVSWVKWCCRRGFLPAVEMVCEDGFQMIF